MAKKKENPGRRAVAQNRKAYHNYFIEEKFEAGIVLSGSEVKSLRTGRANIIDSYAAEQDGEIFLINAYIPEYNKAVVQFSHETRRPRKLLLHKRQIEKLGGLLRRKGYTLIALEIYFNQRGRAKVELGLGKGKTKYDKRESEKKKDWEREKARTLRGD